MPVETEQFNQHQMDVRARVDTLAKSVFLLSGGALTLSMSIFLRESMVKVDEYAMFILKTSWWSLFYSMVGFVLVIALIIIRDYEFAERWRVEMKKDKPEVINDPPGKMDFILWLFGITSLVAFVYGFGALTFVAQNLLSGRL